MAVNGVVDVVAVIVGGAAVVIVAVVVDGCNADDISGASVIP